MTESPPPFALLAVIGPPAAGKSVLCADIAARLGAQVFRLREFAHTCRAQGQVAEHMFASTDAFGWFGDDTVAALLQVAFPANGHLSSRLVILENFPGNAHQLHLINTIALARGASLSVLELVAGDGLVHSRARQRRACLTCEPDPRGDPHRPATAAAGRPGRCGRCDGPLIRRRSDAPGVFSARLGRYRATSPAIRRDAVALAVPLRQLDASTTPHDCTTAALAAIASLVPLPSPQPV